MKIKQVEELVGITRKNIRFYEEQGLLNVGRSENGYREYGMEDVERLKKIRLFRRLSVPLEEIRQYFEGTRTLEDILEKQVILLEQERENIQRTQLFCKQMLEQKVKDATWDTDNCLEQMEKMEKEGVRFMDDIKKDIQKKRQRGALLGAGIMLVIMLTIIAILLWANSVEPLPIGMLLYLIGIPALVMIGVLVALISRMKEIKGGEEDEASKY